MEFLWFLLAITVLVTMPAGFILGVVALVKLRVLRRRVESTPGGPDLEPDHPLVRRLAAMERRLYALEQRAGPAAEPGTRAIQTPAPAPAPAEPAVAAPPPRPQPTPPAAQQPPPPPEPPIQVPERPPVEPSPVAPAPPEPPSAPPPRKRVDWERWIGVRGMAAAAGVLVGLAGILFIKYSIEHGLIPPVVRVIMGMVTGLVCVFGSELLRRRRQPAVSNAMAGGGVVILYATVWGAQHLYHLFGTVTAFVIMLVITSACGALAHNRSSRMIALLGLLGGFATPLLVSSGSDRPIELFTYVLVLDAGLLWLARRRQWPVLTIFCLAGTALYQAGWIFDRMDAGHVGLGLAILAVFAVAFLVLGRQEEEEHPLWRFTRATGLLLPFAFALYFAGNVELGEHLAPLGALLLLLGACACWLALRQPEPLLAPLAASATLGVVTVWYLNRQLEAGLAWEGVAVCAALAIPFVVAAEMARRRSAEPGQRSASAALLILSGGLLAILVIAAAGNRLPSVWPWLAGWAVQAAALIHHGRRPGRGGAMLAAGAGSAFGLLLFAASHVGSSGFHQSGLYIAVMATAGVVWQLVAVLTRQEPSAARWAERSAAAAALVLQLGLFAFINVLRREPGLFLGAATVFAILICLAATRARSGGWYLTGTLSTALLHSAFVLTHVRSTMDDSLLNVVLLVLGLTVAGLAIWPTLAGRGFAGTRTAWYGSALAGPLWFLALREAFEDRFGDDMIAVLPLALAALALAVVVRARRLWPDTTPVRSSALAWLMAVTLSFVSVAIPLQLDKQWITLGWALNGLAIIALWNRLDHPGLKYFGLALLAAATTRLVVNPAVLGYYPRGEWHIINWLLYTYLVPAAALLVAARILHRKESERLRQWEQALNPRRYKLAASLCGLAAVAVVFAWINLTIADFFGTGTRIVLSLERMPARDVTTSIAWAAYALILLGIGMWRDHIGLRWLAFGLIMVTIAKVFLHDLGKLEGLYLVLSPFGLAIILFLAAYLYQRFIMRTTPSEEQ